MASDGYLESLSKLNFLDPSHQPLKPTATTSSVNSYPTVSLLPTHPSFSPCSWSAQQASTYLDFYGIRKVGKAGKETSCFLIYCCNDFHEGPFSRRPPPPQPQACILHFLTYTLKAALYCVCRWNASVMNHIEHWFCPANTCLIYVVFFHFPIHAAIL